MAFDDPFNTGISSTDDNPSHHYYNVDNEDPVAEFLEREKRELGDITGNTDADYFTNSFTTPSNNINNDMFTNGITSYDTLLFNVFRNFLI